MSVDRRALFLSTLADLETKIGSRDPYDLLRSSLLIRQLFLDEGSSLVDQVNREARIKLRFTIVEYADLPLDLADKVSLHILPDGLDPDVYDSLPAHAPARKTVTRDQFFSARVGVVGGRYLTTLDVVKHVAFTMGGIHAGMSKTEEDKVLASIGEQLRIGGVEPAMRILRAAGKGCVRALTPLRAAVSTSLAKEQPRTSPATPNSSEFVEEVKPATECDWSCGHQLFCVLEMRGRLRTDTILCSYGRDAGPRISLSVDHRAVRFRLVDARGQVHDELVDLDLFPMKEGKKNLLQYEVGRTLDGAKWRSVVSLDGEEMSSAVFDAQLNVRTTDNVSKVANRAEDVLAVHTMGHGPLPSHEPDYRRKLFEWARHKYGIGA